MRFIMGNGHKKRTAIDGSLFIGLRRNYIVTA